MRSVLIFILLFPFFFSCDWIPEDLSEDGSNRIGNLEVMNKDLGEMNWDDAMKEVAELGDGWRLPTKEECLNILEPNESKLLNLKTSKCYYWTSSEGGPYSWTTKSTHAYVFQFGLGKYSHCSANYKHINNYVRAVRDIK
jgi:hypothetical protein